MSILTDALPDAVVIDGQAVPIETDFRAGLRTILAFEDDSLTRAEKMRVLLENLYPEPPANLREAVAVGVKFLNGGEASDGDGAPGLRLYSLAKDERYIYAAFRQSHGVDLQTATLHWWQFLALFMDLGSQTTFCSMVALRKRVKTGKATKEERRAYREMQDVLDVPAPDTRTPEERARYDQFMRALKGA